MRKNLDIQIRQIAPYWVLGIVLGSAVSVFGKRYIHGAFSKIGKKRTGWLGMIPASLLGIASPLCMYGTIPIAAAFSEQGVADDILSAFMMSSILLNPQLILYSGALGSTAVLIRCVSCFLCGCCAGWLVRALYGRKNRAFFDFSGFQEGKSRDTDPNILLRFLKNIGRNIRATGPMFLLGILLTALYQIHVPPDFVSGLFGKDNGFGVLMAADGSHDRSASVYVRRRDYSSASAVVMGRHEHGQRGGIHDYRSGHEDHQPGCDEDRAGLETVFALYPVCTGIFVANRDGGQYGDPSLKKAYEMGIIPGKQTRKKQKERSTPDGMRHLPY